LFRDNHMMGNLFGIVEGCLDKIFWKISHILVPQISNHWNFWDLA
jgi:hypothetical protein